jgi:hypothetical protein
MVSRPFQLQCQSWNQEQPSLRLPALELRCAQYHHSFCHLSTVGVLPTSLAWYFLWLPLFVLCFVFVAIVLSSPIQHVGTCQCMHRRKERKALKAEQFYENICVAVYLSGAKFNCSHNEYGIVFEMPNLTVSGNGVPAKKVSMLVISICPNVKAKMTVLSCWAHATGTKTPFLDCTKVTSPIQ